ncbi:hypothetical protein KG089_05305 [Carnobacteriaceae bacterium zg-ZUI252]|nr:hypothetical protein [Carnobacteriaceae bacterium zg-ZUI252]
MTEKIVIKKRDKKAYSTSMRVRVEGRHYDIIERLAVEANTTIIEVMTVILDKILDDVTVVG